MTLTDTPGLMWPKIAFDADGYMLAASHAIGRNAVIDEEVTAFLGEILLLDYRSGTLGRISLETPETRAVMIEATAMENDGDRQESTQPGDGTELQ